MEQHGGKLHIEPRYLLILLLPLGVLFGLQALLHAFGDAALPPPTMEDGYVQRIAELVGRYRFMTAFAFSGAVSLSVIAILTFDLLTNYARSARYHAVTAILIAAALSMGFTAVEQRLPWSPSTRDLLGTGILEQALETARVNFCALAECRLGGFVVREALSAPINLLTPLAASAGMVGLILSLARPRGDAAVEREAESLRAGERTARRYLFCVGALLTAGMMFLMSWMRWPADLISDTAERAAYLELVGALSLYIGAGYSVLIVSGYLPVMLIHAVRVERFKRRFATVLAQREADPAVAVPELRYVEGLNRLLAVLAPILASVIGSFGQGVLFG